MKPLGQIQPKGKGGFILVLFLENSVNYFYCLINISSDLKIKLKFEGSFFTMYNLINILQSILELLLYIFYFLQFLFSF